MSKELADLIFPNITKTPEDYERIYPERNLKEGMMVTRFAPSPTGFIHVGSLFGANLDRRLASQTNGICYLRIEDTDGKREVNDGINLIINGLKVFNIEFDEGPISETEQMGNYGPYIQSKRKDIYQCYAKWLIERDLAYPCFCSADELNAIRDEVNKYMTEGDLRREVNMNIKTKMEINSYQGTRHKKGLPVRGQRTNRNARTRKGKGKVVANKKK